MTCRVEVARRAHEALRLELMRTGVAVQSAGSDPAAFREAHGRLVAFCTGDLLPHLERDEQWLARAEECPEGRLLAIAMRAEARALAGAVHEIAAAGDACAAGAATRVVHALFAAHINHAELLATAVTDTGVAAQAALSG